VEDGRRGRKRYIFYMPSNTKDRQSQTEARKDESQKTAKDAIQEDIIKWQITMVNNLGGDSCDTREGPRTQMCIPRVKFHEDGRSQARGQQPRKTFAMEGGKLLVM
jgi:hypothetical protein